MGIDGLQRVYLLERFTNNNVQTKLDKYKQMLNFPISTKDEGIGFVVFYHITSFTQLYNKMT